MFFVRFVLNILVILIYQMFLVFDVVNIGVMSNKITTENIVNIRFVVDLVKPNYLVNFELFK